MSEPVAYLNKYLDNSANITRYKPENQRLLSSNPLYTSERLRPRVKMTQVEFNEWKELYEDRHATTIYDFIIYVLNRRDLYPDMTNKLMCGSGAVKAKSQAKIADLIVNYNPDNPEETIEIIPDMKWFVRSKEQYQPDMDQGISESGYLYLTQGDIYSIEYYDITTFKDEAQQFETQAEAERWTTPLTEAVQLPVEDNND